MALKVPTANLYFDTRSKLKNSQKHPVQLTVYYAGYKKRYGLRKYFTKAEWKKINSPRLRDTKLKEEKIKLDYYAGEKFDEAIKKVGDSFTFKKFESIYFDHNKSQLHRKDVYALFEKVIADKIKDGKVGTAEIYRTALNSLKQYRSRLSFSQITPDFLRGYETHMTKAGKKMTYISINLRHLRSVYNIAVHEGLISDEDYPFSRSRNDKKYKIKKGSNKNIALTTDELKRLRKYEPETSAQRRAYLYWWFSFYCNGMNVKDICQLQCKHIKGDTIEYFRAKTIDTETEIKPIHFKISKSISAIIEELGNTKDAPNQYIFNILRHGDSPQEVRKKVQNLTRVINTHMKRISKKKLEFGKEITTYTARHSYATYMYRTGSSIEEISEALGHASVETTQKYLASFDEEVLLKQSEKLEEI